MGIMSVGTSAAPAQLPSRQAVSRPRALLLHTPSPPPSRGCCTASRLLCPRPPGPWGCSRAHRSDTQTCARLPLPTRTPPRLPHSGPLVPGRWGQLAARPPQPPGFRLCLWPCGHLEGSAPPGALELGFLCPQGPRSPTLLPAALTLSVTRQDPTRPSQNRPHPCSPSASCL